MRAPHAAATLVAVAALGVGHGIARADIPEPPPRLWLGAGAVLVPSGTLTLGDSSGTQREPTAFAYGGEVLVERAILPNLAWMLAPRIITNVQLAEMPIGDPVTLTQLDVRLGLRTGAPLRPHVDVFGYGAAGYSMLFPDEGDGDFHPQGLLLAAGLGLGYAWNRTSMATLSVGYQIGFQKATYMDESVTFKDSLLDVTVGIRTAVE